MAIETKFQIGDVVYYATTAETVGKLPCPDCRGTRSWQAVSPGGRGYTFACPRCSTNYAAHHELSLRYNERKPATRRLTIGSVRYDSHDVECPVSYMCVETGVGGGSVYAESRLFAIEADALKYADGMAQDCNLKALKEGRYYHGTLEVSDYQLDLAVAKVGDARLSRIGSDIDNLCNDLADVIVDGGDFIETVADWLEKHGRNLEDANPAVKYARKKMLVAS